jgi:ATP-dependent helicase HrpA
VSLFGLLIVPGRSVAYGPIDPQECHKIFVSSALAQGEIKGKFPFLAQNSDLVKRLASIEDKIRRRDILISEEAMAAFYSERLEGVGDVRTLKQRIKENGGDAFLRMKEEDLIHYLPDKTLLNSFPDHIRVGERSFPLTYRFDPGSELDGVTVSVPSTLTNGLTPASLEWIVPGVFEEKLTALIKGLPKRYRKQLVPVAETVEVIMEEMDRTDESLVTALGRFIYRRLGVDIPASAWPVENLPDHLRMRVSITDHKGRELRAARDTVILQEGSSSDPYNSSKAWEEARGKWERGPVTSWDFESLPEKIPVESALVAYPALEPSKHGVKVRLFTDSNEARNVHRKGVARLLSFQLAQDLKFAKKVLRLPDNMEKTATYFGGTHAVEKALLDALIRQFVTGDPRTRDDFLTICREISSNIISKANSLLDKTLQIIENYQKIRFNLHSVETANPANKPVIDLCSTVRHTLNHLVPENFLEIYLPEHLKHIPRYLKAMEIRLERGSYDPAKDETKADEMRVFEDELAEMKRDISPNATEEKRRALDELGWMIEELRVSVFAPELSTAFKVSPKRLRKKVEEIRRMI